ncbi:MAG TPA: hypothetical protein VN132_00730 [Bdellovibrio sp.]|nr:hypothetical protein [Bdellovibrio sp.]
MEKVLTILSLVCISSTVFAGKKTITGVSALVLYSALGGPEVRVPGVVGLAESGRIECSAEKVGSSDAYYFCSVDQGQEDLGQVFGEKGANLSAALLSAGVPLKVNHVKCERQISETSRSLDQYERTESTECMIKY